MKAIPDHAALLIVGDIDQLSSVGPGQILVDVIASGAVPVVRLEDRVGCLLNEEAKALFAGPQGCLGLLALGDVVACPCHAHRIAALVAEDFAAGMDDPLRLVRPQDAEF